MPVYYGLAETTAPTTSKWATPVPAPTCNAWGWNDGTPTDLGAVTPTAWATGRYYASIDTGATIYQKVTFSFTTTDENYSDATAACSYEMAMMGMTAAKVGFIDASISTVDGVVDSILEDTAAIPAQFLAIQGADSDTLETLSDQMDGIATWTATSISSSVTAGSITQIKGNTWNFDIEDLTLDSNKIQLCIKKSKNNTDAESIIMIDTDTGLLYVNGEAATAGDGSLSYAGTTLTVVVDETVTDDLAESASLYYGIQSITAAGVVTESYGGTFIITNDTVKAVS